MKSKILSLLSIFLLFMVMGTIAQTARNVGGIVYDDNGNPLSGVTVTVKNSKEITTTNESGNFTIQVPANTSVLEFSYIGFAKREVLVGTQNNLTVNLIPGEDALDEVVVIGYGSVRRSDLTGAVSVVSAQDIEKLPAANIAQALQGNATGVYTLESDRNPGGSPLLNIRGNNSMTEGSGTPLYVVDGFPVPNRNVNLINPSDIESITILKDASSTAIYGARAANGVVLITTKSGKEGRTVLDIDVYKGVKRFNNPVEVMNAQQFAELRRESYASDGTQMPGNAFLPTELEMLDNGQSTDWWKQVTNPSATTESYQISLSSGNERTKVFLGGGYFNDVGIVNNSYFKRGNLRFNAIQKIGEKFTLSSFNNLSIALQKGSDATNILFPANIGNPMSPVKNDNGVYYVMIQNALGTPRANPVAFSELQINKNFKPYLNSSLALNYEIMEGLNIKTQLSGELDHNKVNFYNPILISGQDEINGRISDGYAYASATLNYNWISESSINFIKSFNEIHHLNAVAAFSAQKNHYESFSASASGFASDAYESYSLGSGQAPARKPYSYLEEWQMLSYVGRVIYTLHDKYIFTGNFRADGSSRFGAQNKWGFFPSGAFAWRISQEPFIQNQEWINDLKFRVSYGLTGNSNVINPYQTFARLGYAPYNWNNAEAGGYYVQNIPSFDLRWESTAQFNVGFDFSILNNRLTANFDYYNTRTNGLLRMIEIPSISGFPNVYKNIGDMKNTGVELGLQARIIDREFKWNAKLLVSSNRNELLSLGDTTTRIGTDHWVGKPLSIGQRYMIRANGIWQANEAEEAKKFGAKPGDVRYVDENGDGKIDADDRVFAGSFYPKYYGSLTNDFLYKNFDLTIFTTFSQGRDVYNGNNYILLSGAGVDNNRIEMLDRWTPDNPSNKYPRASANASNRRSDKTSEFLEDASFIKIKTITLGYTFPERIVSGLKASSLRLYGTVYNPFTFTKFTGMDPEDGDIGNNSRTSYYPITTTYILGLKLSF